MRLLTVFIYFLSIVVMPIASAGTKNKSKTKPVPAVCSAEKINQFKTEYVKLQNALKYEGKDIELKKGRSIGIGESSESDNSPGKKIEISLYKQYKNALIKVGKIYQKINHQPSDNDKKLLRDNPDLVNFFKTIDPKNMDPTNIKNLNIDILLEKLKKVQVEGFALSDEDTYLLKNLLIHSRDRICTLEQYKNNKKHSKTAYLEQLSKAPLNKMIESLKNINGSEDLQLADEETTISEAIKESLDQLHKLITEHKECITKLKNGPQLGDNVQTCNYKKFIKSLSADNFNQIEAILHFINANQKAQNARTDLSWINTQFLNESKTSCIVDEKTSDIFVQNFPLIDGKKIDASKISCSSGDVLLKAEECVKGLNYEFENGRGTKVTPKKFSDNKKPITSFSIKDGDKCDHLKLSLHEEAIIPPNPPEVKKNDPPKTCDKESCEKLTADGVVSWDVKDSACYSTPIGKERTKLCEGSNSPSPEEECKKDPNKEWKDNACLNKVTKATMTEEECKKDSNKEWKDDKCSDKPQESKTTASSGKEKCEKTQKDWEDADKSEARFNRYIWDESKKECKDKQAKKSEAADDNTPEAKPDVIYPNKPVPGRFQPITIPTRQIYILPGMP